MADLAEIITALKASVLHYTNDIQLQRACYQPGTWALCYLCRLFWLKYSMDVFQLVLVVADEAGVLLGQIWLDNPEGI